MTFKKLVLLFTITMLVACNHKTVEEEIYTYLEEAVKLEEEFIDKQDEITMLEAEEQEIYNEIIDLGTDDWKRIQELSQTALNNINQRRELIILEKQSIESSQNEFQKTEELIKEIEDKVLEKKSEDMYEKMINRYEAYYKLNDAYLSSLELETELYEMLQNENLKQEKLTNHIEKINKSYEKVLEVNEKFNEYTLEYNDLKKEFYEEAGFEVTYEEENVE